MAACTRISGICMRCCGWRRSTRLTRVFVHAFMDGRDTMPTSGLGYLEELEQKFREYGVGKLASVSGRYFAMDRDLRWEKERKAFDAMVTGQAEGGAYRDAMARVRESYNNGVTDEFIEPFVVVDASGHAGRADPRRRCRDLLQLSRGPRAADYAGAGAAISGLTARRRAATCRRRRSWMRRFRGECPEEPALRVHDAVRQELQAADGDSAGVAWITCWRT